MTTYEPHLTWATRVERWKIRRLYESEATRRLDEDLLDEVGVSLYARCQSILKLTDAYIRGLIECPACSATIRIPVEGRHRNKDLPIRCPDCRWATTWLAFKHTFQDKRLHAGNAGAVFQGFVAEYPRAKSAQQKMVLIDWLLHEFHKVRNQDDTGPAASNLIEGTPRQVLALLDELAGLRPDPERSSWRLRLAASGTGRRLGLYPEDGER